MMCEVQALLANQDTRRVVLGPYRGTSLKRNRPPLGPYSRPMPRALWWS